MKTKNNQTQFIVEANIPAPHAGRGRKTQFPFREMKIGDSFFVAAETKPSQAVRTSAYQFASKNKEFRFVTRGEKGGVRVWRIEVGHD